MSEVEISLSSVMTVGDNEGEMANVGLIVGVIDTVLVAVKVGEAVLEITVTGFGGFDTEALVALLASSTNWHADKLNARVRLNSVFMAFS